MARLELGLTYEEMAEALGKPSWNAARMAVARALIRLASELKDTGYLVIWLSGHWIGSFRDHGPSIANQTRQPIDDQMTR